MMERGLNHLCVSMACIGLVQSFGREAEEYSRFRGTVCESVRAWWRLNWQQIAYNLVVGATFGVGAAAVFGYGGYLVYRDQVLNQAGEAGMTVGGLYIFINYLAQLYQPLSTLSGRAK